MNIGNDAVGGRIRLPGQEVVRRCKSARRITERTKAVDESRAERFVIVDDRDQQLS
jgi:hypothetical protein